MPKNAQKRKKLEKILTDHHTPDSSMSNSIINPEEDFTVKKQSSKTKSSSDETTCKPQVENFLTLNSQENTDNLQKLNERLKTVNNDIQNFKFSNKKENLIKSVEKIENYKNECEGEFGNLELQFEKYKMRFLKREEGRKVKVVIEDKIKELERIKVVNGKLEKFKENLDLELYEELKQDPLFPKYTVLKNKFINIEHSVLLQATKFYNSIITFDYEKNLLKVTKSGNISKKSKNDNKVPHEIYKNFIRPVEEVEFLSNKIDKIIEKSSIFVASGSDEGKFMKAQSELSAINVAQNISQLLSYYDKNNFYDFCKFEVLECNFENDIERNYSSKIISEKQLRKITSEVGKLLPLEQEDFLKFKNQFSNSRTEEDFEGLQNFETWTNFINNLDQTYNFKLKSRTLLEARSYILTEIKNDSTMDIPDASVNFAHLKEEDKIFIEKGKKMLKNVEILALNVSSSTSSSPKMTSFSGSISSYIFELTELIEFFEISDKQEYNKFIINVLKLFLIITPSVQEDSLREDFRNSILLYNNVCYLVENTWKLGLKNCQNKVDKDETKSLYKRLQFFASDILSNEFKNIMMPPLLKLSEKFPKLESRSKLPIAESLLQEVLDFLEIKIAAHGKIMSKSSFFSILLNPFLKKLLKILTQILISYDDIIEEESNFWIHLLRNLHSQIFEICKENVNSSQLLAEIDVLNQMVFILDCTLTDLDESYCDGKGPLARYFSNYQLRRFVRALWSVSDRRAAMLEKLRD